MGFSNEEDIERSKSIGEVKRAAELENKKNATTYIMITICLLHLKKTPFAAI